MRLIVLLVYACGLLAGEPDAAALAKRAKRAERDGKVVDAYLLYAQAAALDPSRRDYWASSYALRTAALRAQQATTPPAATPNAPEPAPADPALSRQELQEAAQLAEPARLKLPEGRRGFDLRGDARRLFEEVSKTYGLDAIFDLDYMPNQPIRFRLEDATAEEALRTLELLTGSFIVPVGERLFLVVKDTPPKRQERETNVAVVVPIPETVTVQEAQELAQAVRQVMDLTKLQVDTARRIVLIRDRVSKVRPAELLFTQLLAHRAQVVVEMEFLDVAKNSSLGYGLSLPTRFPLVNFGSVLRSVPAVPSGFTNFLAFGAGKTFLGFGVTNAELFASLSRSQSQSLLRAELRGLDGLPASLHVGDKYPIVTNAYLGGGTGVNGDASFAPPPSFTFEDLGLTLKITPKVHGTDDVTLDLEAEFKVLGAGGFNGIPIISRRSFKSQVRLRAGEWGIVAGLVTSSQARTLTGLAGLTQIPFLGPLLGSNTRETSSSEVLLVLKPRIIALPPSEMLTRTLYVGTETRPLTPL